MLLFTALQESRARLYLLYSPGAQLRVHSTIVVHVQNVIAEAEHHDPSQQNHEYEYVL